MTYKAVTFRDMPIGTIFTTTPTGSAYGWLKVSTRTARLNGNGSVFYFRFSALCHVDSGHWDDVRAKPNKENNDG